MIDMIGNELSRGDWVAYGQASHYVTDPRLGQIVQTRPVTEECDHEVRIVPKGYNTMTHKGVWRLATQTVLVRLPRNG